MCHMAYIDRAVDSLLKNLHIDCRETSEKSCEDIIDALENIYYSAALVFFLNFVLDDAYSGSEVLTARLKFEGLAEGIITLVRSILHQMATTASMARTNVLQHVSHTECLCLDKLRVLWRLVHL